MKKRDVILIITASIILGFSIQRPEGIYNLLINSLKALIIILVNIVAKDITAYYFDGELELDLFSKKIEKKNIDRKKKKNIQIIPLGIILPPFLSIWSNWNITWLAPLTFDVKRTPFQSSRRHGLDKYYDISEYHIGLTAAAGIIANIILGVLLYNLNYPNIAKLSIYFAMFNMIPFFGLDGEKILFGSKIIWKITTAITVIAVLATLI